MEITEIYYDTVKMLNVRKTKASSDGHIALQLREKNRIESYSERSK